MAPKKRLPSPPLEDDQKPLTQKQPEDEVSDEEEEDSSEGEGSSSEEGSSSSEEEIENPPPSTPISNPIPASESENESGTESGSDSGSGSGSESETDAEPEPTPPPNPKVKPLASKPMKAQPKAQTQAQTTSAPARSGTKRAAENGNDSNRSKKKTTAAVASGSGSNDENETETEEDVKLTGEDSKKGKQRVFSEEDELTILKGLADFISKTGRDPLKDGTAFHSFLKKSLSVQVSNQQLKRKVRDLKKKYETSDSFTKAHDLKAFELCKKVWGNDGKVNGNIVKDVKKEANGSVKKELGVATKEESVEVESDADTSLILSELFRFGAGGLSALSEDLMKRGLELMEESKRVEFEEKWRQLQIAEVEFFQKRSRVVSDYSNLILQAINKSSK